MEYLWDRVGNIGPLALVVIQGIFAWFMWSMRKEFVVRKDCDGRCKKLEDKQTKLETAHQAMPTPEDVSVIKDRLGGIEGEMKGLAATVQGQAEIMRRIEVPLNQLMQYHIGRDK